MAHDDYLCVSGSVPAAFPLRSVMMAGTPDSLRHAFSKNTVSNLAFSMRSTTRAERGVVSLYTRVRIDIGDPCVNCAFTDSTASRVIERALLCLLAGNVGREPSTAVTQCAQRFCVYTLPRRLCGKNALESIGPRRMLFSRSSSVIGWSDSELVRHERNVSLTRWRAHQTETRRAYTLDEKDSGRRS